MNLSHILAIFAISIATILAATQVPLPWYVSLAIVGFIHVALYALLSLTSENRRATVMERLSVKAYNPLYERYSDALIRFGTWLLPGPQADTHLKSDWQIVRGVFNYRLLDRAMLFAVVYPILLLVVFWAASGQAARLGEVVIAPAAENDLQRLATLGAIAVILGSFVASKRVSACCGGCFGSLRIAGDWRSHSCRNRSRSRSRIRSRMAT